MPLYFFHLNFGHRVLPDQEGIELPNRSAAREEALAVVRDLADRNSILLVIVGRVSAGWSVGRAASSLV